MWAQQGPASGRTFFFPNSGCLVCTHSCHRNNAVKDSSREAGGKTMEASARLKSGGQTSRGWSRRGTRWSLKGRKIRQPEEKSKDF